MPLRYKDLRVPEVEVEAIYRDPREVWELHGYVVGARDGKYKLNVYDISIAVFCNRSGKSHGMFSYKIIEPYLTELNALFTDGDGNPITWTLGEELPKTIFEKNLETLAKRRSNWPKVGGDGVYDQT